MQKSGTKHIYGQLLPKHQQNNEYIKHLIELQELNKVAMKDYQSYLEKQRSPIFLWFVMWHNKYILLHIYRTPTTALGHQIKVKGNWKKFSSLPSWENKILSEWNTQLIQESLKIKEKVTLQTLLYSPTQQKRK